MREQLFHEELYIFSHEVHKLNNNEETRMIYLTVIKITFTFQQVNHTPLNRAFGSSQPIIRRPNVLGHISLISNSLD